MLYLNGIPADRLTVRTSGDGTEFVVLFLPCKESLNGKMSLSFSMKQVLVNKQSPETHRNLILGDPDKEKPVSILADDGKGTVYKQIKMKNSDIYKAYLDEIKKRTENKSD
ncbi:MAG: hypothetical protein IJ561_05910 [Ruminococcus sp.]|nr:hypothetical protein [Ruminococcus sp.]